MKNYLELMMFISVYSIGVVFIAGAINFVVVGFEFTSKAKDLLLKKIYNWDK